MLAQLVPAINDLICCKACFGVFRIVETRFCSCQPQNRPAFKVSFAIEHQHRQIGWVQFVLGLRVGLNYLPGVHINALVDKGYARRRKAHACGLSPPIRLEVFDLDVVYLFGLFARDWIQVSHHASWLVVMHTYSRPH